MTPQGWSFLLGWSRVGVNAALFLAATRVLTLSEIGLFATAFAPVRLLQSVQKAGLSDAVVMFVARRHRWSALLTLSVTAGVISAAVLAGIGAVFSPVLLMLATIPVMNGIGAVPDGILRARLAMKPLALRTLAAQTLAACLALILLWQGAGLWALVAFAVTSAALTNLMSVWLAGWWPSRRPGLRDLALIAPKVAQIAGRVLLTGGTIPLAQMAIGLTLGSVAAGAFQIATRMMDLIEALTLSPIRYITLPRLARSADLAASLGWSIGQTVTLSAWVWGGTMVASAPILTLAVGSDHAATAAPVLRVFAALGLMNALMMPVLQALTARQYTGLVLTRAALILALSAALLLPALTQSALACAVALTAATGLSNLWILTPGVRRLSLGLAVFQPAIIPLIAAAGMVITLAAAPPMPLALQILVGTAVYGILLLAAGIPRRQLI